MKKNLVLISLLFVYLFSFAQQPRLPIVDGYLQNTGNVSLNKAGIIKKYCLPLQRYKDNEQLLLNSPVFREKGVRNIIPFGYRLNRFSEIKLNYLEDNLQESFDMQLPVNNYFNSIKYLFCDSMVYGIKLILSDNDDKKLENIIDELNEVFINEDYKTKKSIVYSNCDFALRVNFNRNEIEIYSLFHYPIVENILQGVGQKTYYAPFWYDFDDDTSIMLAFSNQESKENNVQSLFKVYYKGKTPFNFNLIRFTLDDKKVLEYVIEPEFVEKTETNIVEKDTRVFIFPEDLQKMAKAATIKIEIISDNSTIIYQMPWFQKHSLHTIFEYFRWQATNPMQKYRGV